jgi:hypothetical protein
MAHPTASVQHDRSERAAEVLARPAILRLASSCAATLIAGPVVGGFGTRLAMRLSAMAADDSRIGMITDNGNVVGEITGEGTLALLVFVGLVAGASMGLMLFVLRTVLPGRLLPLSVSIVLLALGSPLVIDPGNPDFTILGNRALNVTMFVTLFPAFGCLSVWLAERFDRWLLRRPLVRLAPLTLAGTALGAMLGVLGVALLAGAARGLVGASVLVVAALGVASAVTSGKRASRFRGAALGVLLVASIAGLTGFVGDVTEIVG